MSDQNMYWDPERQQWVQPVPSQQPRPTQPSSVSRKGALIILGVALLGFAGCGVLSLTGNDDSTPGSDDASIHAEVACEDWVKERLKAPATAEFDDPVTTRTGDIYLVAGTVNSQNSFGALLPNRYSAPPPPTL